NRSRFLHRSTDARRGVKSATKLAAAVVAAALSACSLLYPTGDYISGKPPGTDAGGDGGTDAEAGCGDTKSSPDNCGACGHSCRASPHCNAGLCDPEFVSVSTGTDTKIAVNDVA